MNDELLIPFPYDHDPDYYWVGFPSPIELTEDGGASALLNYFDSQKALVPDLYKDSEVWNVQDLDDYQDLIARFINYYVNKSQLPTNEGMAYPSAFEQDLS